MGILKQIMSLLGIGETNQELNDENETKVIELIKRKIEELEKTISDNKNSENSEDIYKDLIPSLLLIHDYTNELLMKSAQKSDSVQNMNYETILQQLINDLEFQVNNNPLNVLFGKLFQEFGEVEYKFRNVSDINDLARVLKNEQEKLKTITELEKKLESIISQESLDYSQYKVLEQLHKTFPIARRIQNIYIQSILQTDLFTNDYLVIKDNKEKFLEEYPELSYLSDDYDYIAEKAISILKQLRKYFNERDFLKNKVLNYTTKYGICFVEILHKEEFIRARNPKLAIYQNIDNIIKEEIITEDIQKIKSLLSSQNDRHKITEHILDSVITNLVDIQVTDNINSDDTLLVEDNEQNELEIKQVLDSFDLDKLNKLKVIVHKPYNVIPIHDGYNTIYGYLVIDKSLLVDGSSKDEMLEKLARVFTEVNVKQIKYSQAGKKLFDTIADHFIQNIDKQLKKLLSVHNNKTTKEKLELINQILSQEFNSPSSQTYQKLKYAIYNYLLEFLTNKTLTKLKVRIVLPQNMIRFYLKESEFPYGESVLSDIVLHSILYLISVYSNIVNRVSRSSLYRVWRINPGVLKSKTTQINRLISYIKSKPITINDLGDISKIPNIITAYRDVVQVIDNTGQPVVDLSINRAGDPTVRIQDIQDYKMDIAMLSGIPSQRLGIQDNYELREKLVQTSIQFAETISEIQDTLVKQLLEFYSKVLKISHPSTFGKLNYNIFNFIDVSFHKPVQLKLLYLESIFSSINNILGILSQIPNFGNRIDYVKLLKQLVPYIDWENMVKPEITKEQEIENAILNQNNSNQQNDQNQQNPPPGNLF
jgi:hypothetical protein